MDIVYKIELKWHLGFPDSDTSFTEVIPLFDATNKEISQNLVMKSLENAKLFKEYDFVEIYDGIHSAFQAKLNGKSYDEDIYVDVHLVPLLEKNGMYFELSQVYV